MTGVKAYIQRLSRRFPDEILIAHNERDKGLFDIYRTRLDASTSILIEENTGFRGFVTDDGFDVRLAIRYTDDGDMEYLRRDALQLWERATLIPAADIEMTRPVEYSDDGTELFWIDSRERNTAAVLAEDVQSGAGRVLASDD